MPHPFTRILAPLLAALALSACAAHQAEQAELRAAAAAEIARRPGFYTNGEARAWSVRKDGAERGLLWGTFHIAYGNDTVLPGPIRARFYEAADLTVEVVLDRVPDALRALRATTRTANAATDPKALAALDPATRHELDTAVPDAATRKLSLRGLALLVRAQASQDQTQLLPNVGFVDLNLIAFARQQNRPVRGLEPPGIVDPTLAEPNGPEAAGLLGLELRRAATLRAMGDWVRTSYGQGDVAGSAAVLAAWRTTPDDLRRYDADRQNLLTRRNAAWLPALARLFRRPGDHFVAVGAGHLPGQDGLVALLRAQGFDVVPCPRDACPAS